MKVLVSIPPQVEWVKAVGGDYVDILTFVPKNTKMDGYSLTPLQLSFVTQAQLYVAFGHLPFETSHMEKIVSANSRLKILRTSQGISKSSLNTNPYIWMSPINVVSLIEQIRDTLIEMDPKRTKYYKKRADRYVYHLRFLDKKIKNHMAKHKRKTLLSAQPIFTDYAAQYNVKQLVVGEQLKGKMDSVIRRARRAKVGAVVIQRYEDRELLETIAKEIRAEIIDINPLSRSYLEMMEEFGLNLSISFIRKDAFKNRR